MSHRKALGRYVALCAFAMAAAVASAQPVVIGGVPDWNQPTVGVNGFVQPPDGPPNGAPNGVANWCTPTAAANVMGYLEDVMGCAGLGDGVLPGAAGAYPNNGVADGVDDFQQNQWHDGIIELGYYMDTQTWFTKAPLHPGTSLGAGVADIPGYAAGAPVPGITGYMQAYGNQNWQPNHAWNFDGWNGGAGAAGRSFDDYVNGNQMTTIPAGRAINNGIDFDDAVMVSWDRWLNLSAPPNGANRFMDNTNEIEWFDWNGAAATGDVGHTVTGIGYALDYDPDDDGTLPQTTWMICHDGWSNTGHANTGHVAVPWNENFWWANTHVEVPEPATVCLLLMGGTLAVLRKRRH